MVGGDGELEHESFVVVHGTRSTPRLSWSIHIPPLRPQLRDERERERDDAGAVLNCDANLVLRVAEIEHLTGRTRFTLW